MASVTATIAEVAVEGTGITPSTRPGLVPARDRGARSEIPQSGHTLALRSMSPRQFGHIRCAVSYDCCSARPEPDNSAFFNFCSLNHSLGGNSIMGKCKRTLRYQQGGRKGKLVAASFARLEISKSAAWRFSRTFHSGKPAAGLTRDRPATFDQKA